MNHREQNDKTKETKMNRLSKYLNGKKYLAKLNLRQKIELEIAPKLAAIHRVESRMSGQTPDNETQGFVMDLEKYSEERNIGQNRSTEKFNDVMETGKPEFWHGQVAEVVLA